MRKLRALKKIPVFLFVILLTLDVSVLIFEKFGAAAAGTAFGDELGFSLRLLQIPWIWGVGILSILQLLVWSRILRKTDLSVAYPISSLFFPLTMLASVAIFHEHVSPLAWLGGLLVTAGICFVGSEKEVSKPAQAQPPEPSANPQEEKVPALSGLGR